MFDVFHTLGFRNSIKTFYNSKTRILVIRDFEIMTLRSGVAKYFKPGMSYYNGDPDRNY